MKKNLLLFFSLLLLGYVAQAQFTSKIRKSTLKTDSLELEKLKKYDPDFIQLKRLEFNTSRAEYAPVFYSNGIVFSKSKSILTDFSPTKRLKRKYKSTLYFSSLDVDYRKAKPLKIKGNNNIAETQSIFHKPSESIYYTALSSTTENIINKKSDEINSSKFSASTFNLNGTFYSTINQCISKSGKKLFFSSNLQDGYGGMDIYVSEWIDDEWSEPVNLGPKVNTAADDLYPFIFEDSLLYFATSGRLGLGGLDVFVYNFKEKSTKNLGAPINSAYDDFGLIRFTKVNNGYFSSNRADDGTNTDVYAYKSIRPSQREININVIDADTKSIVENVKLNISSDLSEEVDLYKLMDGKLEGMKFEMGVPYKFYLVKLGYISKMSMVVFKKTDKVINLTIERDPDIDSSEGLTEEKWYITRDNKFKTKVKEFVKRVIKPNRLKDSTNVQGQNSIQIGRANTIYFDFNKYSLKPESKQLLDQIVITLKEQSTLKATINSYADNRGSRDYNLKLSVKRSNTTARYLTKNGIPKKRIQAIGKGELNPVIKCAKDCTENDHALNRRTEIVIK